MNIDLPAFLHSIFQHHLFASAVVILIFATLYRFLTRFISDKHPGRFKFKLHIGTTAKAQTYKKLAINILRYLFITTAALIILEINGIDVNSLLAGLGIASVVIGLAVQDALKDIIRGSTILSDNYFSVGDVIKYNDLEGQVEVIGLKTTKVRDLSNDNLVSIANRNITQVEVASTNLRLDIPLPLDLSLAVSRPLMQTVAKEVKKDPLIADCVYTGIDQFSDSLANHQISLTLNSPADKFQARRNALTTAFATLESHGVAIPFPQLTLHQSSQPSQNSSHDISPAKASPSGQNSPHDILPPENPHSSKTYPSHTISPRRRHPKSP